MLKYPWASDCGVLTSFEPPFRLPDNDTTGAPASSSPVSLGRYLHDLMVVM